MKRAFLAELEFEAKATRSLLEGLTDDMLDFRLDHKDWNARDLASHIVEIYYWFHATMASNNFDFKTYNYDKGDMSTVSNILNKFEENLQIAVTALDSVQDENIFQDTWNMRAGEQIMMSMPRFQAIRGFLMNHIYHHRGQLSMYLRAAGKPVPPVYGPTQDTTN